MAAGARLIGYEKVIRTCRFTLPQKGHVEYARAAFEEIDRVETPECRRRTPVDTGALQDTVVSFGPNFRGTFIEVGTQAGGGNVTYAVVVHEDLEARHRTGQAKYIESVYRESRPFLTARIAERVRVKRLV